MAIGIYKGGLIKGVANGQIRGASVVEVSSATYSIADSDDTIFVDCSANDVTINLPAISANDNREISVVIEANGANFGCIIAPNGADKIGGLNTSYYVSHAGEGITLLSKTDNWHIRQAKGAKSACAILQTNTGTAFSATTTLSKLTTLTNSFYTSPNLVEANTVSQQFDLFDLTNNSTFVFNANIKVDGSNQDVEAQLFVGGVAIASTYMNTEMKTGRTRLLSGYTAVKLSDYVTVTPTMTAELRLAIETTPESVTIGAGSSVSLERIIR